MFGKMRLLVGCRSGMTVKFASKFHHGNPFVRVRYSQAVRFPLEGALCCSMLVRYRLCEASFEARRNRCAFVRRGLCGSGIGTCKGERLLRRDRAKAIFLRCPPRRHAKGIPCVAWFRPPMHSTRICAALFIVTFTSHGGRKRQENYTVKRPLSCSSCFASACLLGAIPARRDTQKERMPGSPSERCTGRRPANWS